MPSTANWNTSICLRFVRLFARPRKRTTSCLPLFWESSTATPSVSRPRKPLRMQWPQSDRRFLGKTNVHHEETYFAESDTEGRWSDFGVAVFGCNGACLHSSCSNSRGPQAANRLLLHAPRRNHVQHFPWSRHGQMDAQRVRRQFQTQPDSLLP